MGAYWKKYGQVEAVVYPCLLVNYMNATYRFSFYKNLFRNLGLIQYTGGYADTSFQQTEYNIKVRVTAGHQITVDALNDNYLYRVYVDTSTESEAGKIVNCGKNGVFGKESSAVCYAWFVREKGYAGLPQVDWIA